jgi:hypothetical protein
VSGGGEQGAGSREQGAGSREQGAVSDPLVTSGSGVNTPDGSYRRLPSLSPLLRIFSCSIR